MIRDHAALARYLAARQALPFAWGREANDCVSFALGAVEAQTGRRLRSRLPNWSTQTGARRVLARRGGLEAAVSSVLEAIPPAFAARGDIALVRHPQTGAEALFVVEGDTLVGPDASGARRLKRTHMIRAWRAA